MIAPVRSKPMKSAFSSGPIAARRRPKVSRFFPVDENGRILSAEEFAPLVPAWSAEHVARALGSFSRFDTAMLPEGKPDLTDYVPTVPPVRPSLIVVPADSELVPPELRLRLAEGDYVVREADGIGHILHIEDLSRTIELIGN